MGKPSTHAEDRLVELVLAGYFEIDVTGRIWRIRERRAGHDVTVPRRRAEKATPQGYLMVRMMVNGHRICALAHRVVYAHVRGPIPPSFEVNHVNGRKDDNRPENLEAVTASENMKHAHRTGLLDQRGERNPAAALSDADVVAIRVLYLAGEYTGEDLAQLFGVAFQHVSRIVKGERRRTAGGPIAAGDLRHSTCDHDPVTGRFVPKDLRVREFPEATASREEDDR